GDTVNHDAISRPQSRSDRCPALILPHNGHCNFFKDTGCPLAEDGGSILLLKQGGPGNDDRLPHAAGIPDRGEHLRTQLAVSIIQFGPYLDRARLPVDEIADLLDTAAEGPVRKR